jgi:hypothetical protein
MVPPSIDAALRAYARCYPLDANIAMVLDYRKNLWEELEQLFARAQRRRKI